MGFNSETVDDVQQVGAISQKQDVKSQPKASQQREQKFHVKEIRR